MNRERPKKFWIVVVSKDHMEIGKRLGVVQANHGKAVPMKRMRPGDMIIFYSPKVRFEGKEPLKKFTAIAQVKEGEVYQGYMGEGFVAFRRDVEFLACKEADILPLIPRMTFIRNKRSWGFVFRFGFFEIPEKDFKIISKVMDMKVIKAEVK